VNCITIDLDALDHNLKTIRSWVEAHGATLTVVTKALCGHRETLRGLAEVGVDSVADSRLDNLLSVREAMPGAEAWYLRPPHSSSLSEIVRLSDVSLNTELRIVKELDAEARRQGTTHSVVVMIELGDLREGVLPGSLLQTYREIFSLDNIQILGIGANLGCLGGVLPSIDQLMQLVLYRELLELKFERSLPMISAGSSSTLPLLREGRLPTKVNHFRVGESIFLGTDLVQGGTFPELREDAIRLDAEVVEVKEKGMVPLGETSEITPFQPLEEEDSPEPGQRGYRALVTVGQVDTEVRGLTPLDPDYQIAGASSDLTVVNVGETRTGLRVGDSIGFRVEYSSFVRLMANPYTTKQLVRGNQTV